MFINPSDTNQLSSRMKFSCAIEIGFVPVRCSVNQVSPGYDLLVELRAKINS